MTTKVESLNGTLEQFEKDLQAAVPDVEVKARVKGIHSRDCEGTIVVQIFNASHQQESKVQTEAYFLLNNVYRGLVLGTFVDHDSVYQRETGTFKAVTFGPYEFKFDRLDFSSRQKQSSIKVTAGNLREMLVNCANPEQGEIVFGVESSSYGIANKTLDVAIRTDEGLRVFALPTTGFLVDLSRCLGKGKSSQDVLLRYPSILFGV